MALIKQKVYVECWSPKFDTWRFSDQSTPAPVLDDVRRYNRRWPLVHRPANLAQADFSTGMVVDMENARLIKEFDGWFCEDCHCALVSNPKQHIASGRHQVKQAVKAWAADYKLMDWNACYKNNRGERESWIWSGTLNFLKKMQGVRTFHGEVFVPINMYAIIVQWQVGRANNLIKEPLTKYLLKAGFKKARPKQTWFFAE